MNRRTFNYPFDTLKMCLLFGLSVSAEYLKSSFKSPGYLIIKGKGSLSSLFCFFSLVFCLIVLLLLSQTTFIEPATWHTQAMADVMLIHRHHYTLGLIWGRCIDWKRDSAATNGQKTIIQSIFAVSLSFSVPVILIGVMEKIH